MKLNWNFLSGGGGAKQKTFSGGSMEIFWSCILYGNDDFCGGRKTGEPEEKPQSKEENQ